MQKNYLILLIFSLIHVNTYSQQTKNVVFLGNSYTAANNLPLIISKLAQNTGDHLVYSSNTPGGYTLQAHSTNTTSLNLIQQGNIDFVILQEQSQLPSFPISQVVSDVFPYASSLCNTVFQYNPCAKPVFFMTWGRKYGDSQNCTSWPPVCTYNGMDSLLNLRYRMMADSNKAYVSPVGAVWHYIIDNDTTIELYSSDQSHPSLEGSYAAACTFYCLIFQKNPLLISDDYNIDHTKAQKIREAAKLIAFDSLSKWNIGKYLPQAKFTFTQNYRTIHLVNQSKYTSHYLWNFGDSDTSNISEPSHTYTQDGIYNIKLIASKCATNDSITKIVNINTVNIETEVVNNINIFPNPATDLLNIKLDNIGRNVNITIYSIDSKELLQYNKNNNGIIKIDISYLPRGMYFIKIKTDKKLYYKKIVLSGRH